MLVLVMGKKASSTDMSEAQKWNEISWQMNENRQMQVHKSIDCSQTKA